MVTELAGSGEIVEKQSYLNGTRYFLIEGLASDDGTEWNWTLALTLPKEAGEPVVEGDLSLTTEARSWFADIVSGNHSEHLDEAIDAPITVIELLLSRRDEDECTDSWPEARCALELRLDLCDLRLTLRQTD